METITITTEYIRLQDLMKLSNMVSSGGEAKHIEEALLPFRRQDDAGRNAGVQLQPDLVGGGVLQGLHQVAVIEADGQATLSPPEQPSTK